MTAAAPRARFGSLQRASRHEVPNPLEVLIGRRDISQRTPSPGPTRALKMSVAAPSDKELTRALVFVVAVVRPTLAAGMALMALKWRHTEHPD